MLRAFLGQSCSDRGDPGFVSMEPCSTSTLGSDGLLPSSESLGTDAGRKAAISGVLILARTTTPNSVAKMTQQIKSSL